MEKQNKKQEWQVQVIKYQTEEHTIEYSSSNNTHHYTILEHECAVVFDRHSGESKVIKHNV